MPTPADVLDRVRELETELEQLRLDKQKEWRYRVQRGRVRFEQAVRRQHKALRQGLVQYLRRSSLMTVLSAPVIYSVIAPLLLADLWITLYQSVCFPIYGIPKVRRADYIAIDRWRLAYLNVVEKVNCDYCSYANGLLAYLREITARTEQYWCPIRHARAVRGPHTRYRLFADYGDPHGYRREIAALRRALEEERQRSNASSTPHRS